MEILVIEDEKRAAQLIKKGLEEQGFDVQVTYDGLSGKNLALSHSFDLLVIDILLPGLSGLDVCKQVRSLRPQLPIIMLTALGTTDDKVEGFDAGANDYLVKPFDFRELYARIRALIQRGKPNPAEPPNPVLKYADLELNQKEKSAKRGHKEIELTPREFKLLEYMLLHAEKVLSRAELAQNVWNTQNTRTNFIDVYMNYLRKKIDSEFPNKLIHTRSGTGFILKEKTSTHENSL
jgi:two-component system copper resistance phosphate regulon response regulator CusR